MADYRFSCRGCEKRYPGCHDHCDTYKAERAEYEKLKQRDAVEKYLRDRASRVYDAHAKYEKKLSKYKRFRGGS